MHIITLVTDGHGHVRVAATRAPDLFRRQIAAETGTAHLTWCGLAPSDIGSRAFVERLQKALRQTELGAATYALPPQAAVRTVVRLLAMARIEGEVRRVLRFTRHLFRWAKRCAPEVSANPPLRDSTRHVGR